MGSLMQSGGKKHTSAADIFSVFAKHKLVLLALPLLVAVVFAFVLMDMPNRYRADATLISAGTPAGKMSGQLGSLAALAGVNLGGLGGNDKTDLAMEIIVSREFVEQFITKRQLLVPLMAAERAELTTGAILIDKDLYDESTKRWIRQVELPYTAEPSMLEAHKAFLNAFTISKDKIKNTVFISFEHVSGPFARDVINWLIADLNEYMRQADVADAQKSMEFLEQEAKRATVAELRNVIYTLLEDQLKTLMIANVRQEYVFKVIDKAVSPQEKSGPKRAMLLVMMYFFALFLTAGFLIIRARIQAAELDR